MPSKFLQIASKIEQFGNVETMTVDEVVGRLKADEEMMQGQMDSSGGKLLLTQEEWSKKKNKGGTSGTHNQKPRSIGNGRGRGKGAYMNTSMGKG